MKRQNANIKKLDGNSILNRIIVLFSMLNLVFLLLVFVLCPAVSGMASLFLTLLLRPFANDPIAISIAFSVFVIMALVIAGMALLWLFLIADEADLNLIRRKFGLTLSLCDFDAWLGDLQEGYSDRIARDGPLRANCWRCMQIVMSAGDVVRVLAKKIVFRNRISG